MKIEIAQDRLVRLSHLDGKPFVKREIVQASQVFCQLLQVPGTNDILLAAYCEQNVAVGKDITQSLGDDSLVSGFVEHEVLVGDQAGPARRRRPKVRSNRPSRAVEVELDRIGL